MTKEATTGDEAPKEGRWPSALEQFRWDLGRKDKAPANSGIENPEYVPPNWLANPNARQPEVAEYAKRAHDAEVARAQHAEAKASRLAQTCIGLLAVAFALTAYQVGVARTLGGGWWYGLTVPAIVGVAFLVVAGIGALEIDRVGLYSPGTPEELSSAPDPVSAQTAAEERGRWYAAWTARHKYSDLLQARAWFTRSLVALLVAALVAAGSQAVHRPRKTPADRPSPSVPYRSDRSFHADGQGPSIRLSSSTHCPFKRAGQVEGVDC